VLAAMPFRAKTGCGGFEEGCVDFMKAEKMREGEKLLYAPKLHWFYSIRHLVLSMPFFLVLLGIWAVAESSGSFMGWLAGFLDVPTVKFVARNIFLLVFVFLLLGFVYRILQYLCTEYGVTNRRLVVKRGVVRMAVSEIMCDRIESINCVQGIMGQMLGYGTIKISGVGGALLVFRMTRRPHLLRRKIVEAIGRDKAARIRRGI